MNKEYVPDYNNIDHPEKNKKKKPSVQDRLKEASGVRTDAPLAPSPMNIYFVTSGTADNYIMVETSEGILCSNCAPDGEFAGVDLSSYGENGEKISGELIAAKIAEALDPDLTEDDLDWMGEPCYSNMAAWKAEQEAAEYFNRDEAFFVGSFGAKEINARQAEKAKPSIKDRLKEAGGAKAGAPKAPSIKKKDHSL